MSEEVEVKILAINPLQVEDKLQELGATMIKDVFQTNQYFKMPSEDKLLKSVRIRKEENQSFVTIKRKLARKENGIRTREEYEERITNPEQLENIFIQVGLQKTQLYEMKRKYYQLDGCSVEIVHMATIPTYLEIEGKKEAIYNVASKLGFSEADFLKESFFKVYPQAKENDMLFKNENKN